MLRIDNRSHSPKNQIIYYSSSYIPDAFINSVKASFNENTNGYAIDFLPNDVHDDLYSSYLSNKIKLEPFSKEEGQENGVMPVLVKGHWIKSNTALMNLSDADAFAIITFETSAWKQDATGFLKVYNKNGIVIWRMRLQDFSPHIIMDKNSPYVPKNKQLVDGKVNNNTYYYELKRVYEGLGKEIAQKMLSTLTK